MRSWFGVRTLLAVCGVLAVLLAVLVIVQYRWSARVAAADVEREREHLNSSATLFKAEFNEVVGQAATFVQNDAWAAVRSGKPLPAVPKLIGNLYFLEAPLRGGPTVSQLAPNGRFIPVAGPPEIAQSGCALSAIGTPATLVFPVFHFPTPPENVPGNFFFRESGSLTPRCFVVQLNVPYLRHTLFPRLIRQSFGRKTASSYNFAVTAQGPMGAVLYGAAMHADLQKAFFSPGQIRVPKAASASRRGRVFFQQMIVMGRPATHGSMLRPGIWQLEIARKGISLSAAFRQERWRNLCLSIGVEALLFAATVVLVAGTRKLQRLAEQEMQFVAGVSHELRTPLSAIAMLSLNQADGLVTDPGKVRQYGELVHQQSRRLSSTVEQTLRYAGIHSSLRQPCRDVVDLQCLIEETVNSRREDLERGGFKVEVAISPNLPPLAADRELLRTALDNLLSNAEKHAADGHWIRVSAEYDPSGKEVRMSVEDRGPGIDRDDEAQIFEPFSRGREAVERQTPGTGLGLSLVRSAAEAHRGRVTVASKAGAGANFTIHLPV